MPVGAPAALGTLTNVYDKFNPHMVHCGIETMLVRPDFHLNWVVSAVDNVNALIEGLQADLERYGVRLGGPKPLPTLVPTN